MALRALRGPRGALSEGEGRHVGVVLDTLPRVDAPHAVVACAVVATRETVTARAALRPRARPSPIACPNRRRQREYGSARKV